MSKETLNNQNEEVVFLSDEEVKERKKRSRTKKKPENFNEEKVLEQKNIAENGLCEITFESQGRFDIPAILSFKPYTTLDINNMVLTRQEKIVDILLNILNNLNTDKESCDLSNMLMEEFLELMIAMKLRFMTPKHEHAWICDCQYKLSEDDQQINNTEIDLRTLQYTTITEADKILQDYYMPIIKGMTNVDFDQWKNSTFSNELSKEEIDALNVEEAVGLVKIEEPICINAPDGHSYRFRFNRIGDLIIARKMADNKFSGKFKAVQQMRYNQKNENMAAYKHRKEEAMTDLQEEKAKYAIHVADAMRLLAIDNEVVTSNQHKVDKFGKIDTQVTQELTFFLDSLSFGINDTRDLVCPLCGETKQRSLRRSLNPIEFLPINVNTSRDRKLASGFSVSFGV